MGLGLNYKFKVLVTLAIVLILFSILSQPVFAQEKKKEDSQVSSQTNGLRTTNVTIAAISTTGCSTAPSLGSLSCSASKSGSGSLSSSATNWHKVYASSSGTLTVNLSGPSTADFDLYVYSSCSSNWICRPYTSSSNETCTINASAGSYYYIGINSYSGSGSYSVSTSLSCGGGTTCDSSSYTSCSSAASMSSGSSKSSMCGSQQFYKITTSTPCTVSWSMTPQSTADFDLYVKNSSGSCPSTSSYDCRPYYGTGSQESCSASLPAGTYYAMVRKYGSTGSYNIQVNTSNCGSSCTNECSSGQKRCSGSYSQTCGNYDSDSCYEWPYSTSGSGNTYCSYGCNSSTGQCNSSSCTNDCSSGQTRCNGSYKQTCGNYDSDSCLEWPSSTSGSGNTYCSYGCSNGTCNSSGNCHSGLNGGWDYCSSSCLCNAGEGDCDGDSQCNTGLHCVNDIGSAYGWSSSLDVCLQSVPIETVIAGSTFIRELSSRYRLTSHAEAHGLGLTAATLCNDPYLDSEPVPHINVGIYDTSNRVYVYNLHVGRIQRNNQDCTVVYESANRFCREYCGSERKKPGDVIRGPPVQYPYPIPTGTMDDLLRHHNIYSNPDWPSTFPIQLITILGLIILIVITIGACAISLGTVCPAA